MFDMPLNQITYKQTLQIPNTQPILCRRLREYTAEVRFYNQFGSSYTKT